MRMSRPMMPKERERNKRLAEPARKRRMGSLHKDAMGFSWWTSYSRDAHYTKGSDGVWVETFDWPDDSICVDPSYYCPIVERLV